MSATTASTSTLLRAERFSNPSCVSKIEKQVDRLEGIDELQLLWSSGRIGVDHAPAQTSVEQLIAAVNKAGNNSQASDFSSPIGN